MSVEDDRRNARKLESIYRDRLRPARMIDLVGLASAVQALTDRVAALEAAAAPPTEEEAP